MTAIASSVPRGATSAIGTDDASPSAAMDSSRPSASSSVSSSVSSSTTDGAEIEITTASAGRAGQGRCARSEDSLSLTGALTSVVTSTVESGMSGSAAGTIAPPTPASPDSGGGAAEPSSAAVDGTRADDDLRRLDGGSGRSPASGMPSGGVALDTCVDCVA